MATTCRYCGESGLEWSEPVHKERAKQDLNERFWSKVNFLGPKSCWVWNAAKDKHGYGLFNIKGKSLFAYRVSYELVIGRIPEGLSLDHLCRNPKCVNPLHLEPVTRGENVLRGLGITVQNKNKTHCTHGHPLSDDNLDKHKLSKGQRNCRICKNLSERRRRARLSSTT